MAAAAHTPESLKYAMGGLNQDRDCLIAAGIWDESYEGQQQPATKQQEQQQSQNIHEKRRIVLSTRFSLSETSSSLATSFVVALKANEYIRDEKFVIYSPNAFGKQSCDPEWTRMSWPCRGTFQTCCMEAKLKQGPPTNNSCWRYSFRYQLEQAKSANGFMIQVIELQHCDEKRPAANEMQEGYILFRSGNGQKIESLMAKRVGVKVFRIYQPVFLSGGGGSSSRKLVEKKNQFSSNDIDRLANSIRDWYRGGCSDMTEIDLQCGDATTIPADILRYLR